MRKIILITITILYLKNVCGQVTLFEEPNFQGRGISFGTGNQTFRNTDFDDKASSIKVQPGTVVILYTDANEKEGYGAFVDLLEDCADLSVYGMNDKVSYISVIRTDARPGFVWVRNRMVNNQFLSGHWERKRVDGQLPDNSPPAVPSVRVQPLPTTPTVLSVNGANTIISTLGVQTGAEKLYWEKAMNQQLGVIGNDFREVEEIGSACFQRASNNPGIPDNINFWYPQKQQRDHRGFFKRTLIGAVQKADQYYKSGTFEDFDMNIDIYPDPPYMYLLNEAQKPKYTALMKTQYYASFTKSGESGCPTSFGAIEAEIADRYRPPENYKSNLILLCRNRYGKKIGVYGPWIWDEGHCRHPEIHPAEQVWWSEPAGNYRKFYLNVFCDASGRYMWRNQMDDGTKLKPWAEPPIKGIFAIAFEYELSATDVADYTTRKFEVTNIQHHNVIEYLNADQTYNLVYNGKNIVSFVPHNNAFKVSFEQVGISPDNRNMIRGFLVIETSVGILTQIATEVAFPGSGAKFKLPQGSSPAQAPEILEKKFFKKESGNYCFIVTESSVKDRPIMGQ